MDNLCTIYSHQLALESIFEELADQFPTAEIEQREVDDSLIITAVLKKGFLGGSSKFKISYRERNIPSYKIDHIDSPLTQSLAGMLGFVDTFPANNEEIKNLLLNKISTLNCEFAILVNDKSPDLMSFIVSLSSKLDAITFARPGTIISKSEGPHFLDYELNLILDIFGNHEVDQLEVFFDNKFIDIDPDEATDDQKQRKENSETILKELGVKINDNLPYVESEDETTIRSAEEVSKRLTALAMTNFVAFGSISSEQAMNYIVEYQFLDLLTPKEVDFLKNPTEEKKNFETWKCECIWVFMWALGYIEELGPANVMADLNKIVQGEYPVGPELNPHDFIKKAELKRSKKNILDANDLYYRMDWACVDARINEREIEEVNPGIVYERHYALNWLINYMDQEWDDVSCDT